MTHFHVWGSAVSRLEPLSGGSLLDNTKFQEIPGTHFIDLGRMKDLADIGATQWLRTQYSWVLGIQHLTPSFSKYCIEKKKKIQYVVQETDLVIWLTIYLQMFTTKVSI